MDDQVIGVLGGGQLGRMLLQAASPLSIPIIILDPSLSSPAKQVSSPSILPLSLLSPSVGGTGILEHLTGKYTDENQIRLLATKVDLITIEIEHVNVEALAIIEQEFKYKGGRKGKGVKVFPSSRVIGIIQDKFKQKLYLQEKGVEVAPFQQVVSSSSTSESTTTTTGGELNPYESLIPSILSAGILFGYPLMIKSRHLAYDGKGNYLLHSSSLSEIQSALEALIPLSSINIEGGKELGERLYVEKFAPFVKEIAVMVVKGQGPNNTQLYPAVETIHRNSVCHIVYVPLRPPTNNSTGVGKDQRGQGRGGNLNLFGGGKEVGERAKEMAGRAVDALGEGAVGVFGVEMFLMEDGSLFLNEIAPRPHNSGHYTIEACSPSQYTSHLYSILSLPIPSIQFHPHSAGMLNLLGATNSTQDDFKEIIKESIEMGGYLHLYGKDECRKGRKMGHVTILGQSDEEVKEKIEKLVSFLPECYRDPPSTLPVILTAPNGPHSSPNPLVSIIMGSDSDLPILLPATSILNHFKIPYELSIVSAHRTPSRMIEFAKGVGERGISVIIAGAGGAAHLPGMVASETTVPVIGVPVKGSSLDGVDSLYSIVQMPRGIPVATVAINNSTNAALLAIRILSLQLPRLKLELELYSKNLEEEVMVKIEKLEIGGWDAYGKK